MKKRPGIGHFFKKNTGNILHNWWRYLPESLGIETTSCYGDGFSRLKLNKEAIV